MMLNLARFYLFIQYISRKSYNFCDFKSLNLRQKLYVRNIRFLIFKNCAILNYIISYNIIAIKKN